MSTIIPTCPTGCSGLIPDVDFNNCDPKVFFGEIEKVYLAALEATDLTDFTDASVWAAAIDNTASGDVDSIRELTVSADLPAAEADVVEISNRRKVHTPSTFTINVTIDDVSEANYELMLWTECNTRVKVWFATKDHMYGGDAGIEADIMLRPVIERGVKSMQRLEGTITWESAHSPVRCDNPLT